MNILMVGPHKDKIKGGMSTVIKNYSESEFLKEFIIYNLHTVSLGNKFIKLIYGICSILKMIYYLIFKKISLVHIHTASGNSFARKSIFINISYLFKKQIILHIHGGGFEEFYLEKMNSKKDENIRKVLNKCDYIVVLSDGWKNKIKKMTSSEIVVINNSVKDRDKNNYNQKSNQITFIGRVEREKGIFDLIEAANIIVKKYKNIKFTICGGGDTNTIESIIKEYGIEKNFEILGWVDNDQVLKELKKSMIFILPSHKEAMPMSILEAMSYGVPIISTNIGSIPEFIKQERNGELFNPGDINQLEIAIEKIINNLELRKYYSQNNFMDIKKCYSDEINHNKIKDLYILGGSKSNENKIYRD
ncbi:glycosyltransferase family 4 protein [Romboutsia hominis]|uniref:Glycosyltransferase n=1 Tax=Romboutsia hominis TaxID=1507512 RepID=A0A2P2BSP8_9FIRM|nr:glycosyltransferase family 4 protein [Romboutsia hominis]CEI73366.1 Glycosyltransferase [Romboutsia hominis]